MSDLAGHARREAAEVIAGAMDKTSGTYSWPDLVTLCAIAWLQGANYGGHESLRLLEDALDEVKASL